MKTLVCTVGGSHKPILRAIESYDPEKVLFVCSRDDEVTGTKGSYTQVEGEGLVIASSPGAKPDLRNIPTLAGMNEGTYEVRKVPADEPSEIMRVVKADLVRLAREGEVVADFTGGTKSMSAGLFAAALQVEGVHVSLVRGPRCDLVKMRDGFEAAQSVGVEDQRLAWRLEEARRAWSRFAYGEADRLLTVQGKASPEMDRARTLSRGFDAWDAFDHDRAYGLLRPMAGVLRKDLMPALAQLRSEGQRPEAMRAVDLVWSSRRRASAGRYDTAVLLLYRAFEWIGQWSFRWHHQEDAGDVSQDMSQKLGDLVHTNHKGKAVLGLHNLWTALGRLEGPFAKVGRRTEKERQDFTHRRNLSLYAHGTTPMRREDFSAAVDWFEDRVFAPFLQNVFRGDLPYEQLPSEF